MWKIVNAVWTKEVSRLVLSQEEQREWLSRSH